MQVRKYLILTLLMVFVAVAGSGLLTAQDKTVSVLATWGGAEEEAFLKMVEPFEQKTGIKVLFEGTRDLPTILTTRIEAGNPPDVVQLTGLGLLEDVVKRNAAVDLSSVLDMNTFRREYAESWIDLGSYEGILYGIYMSADIKSLIWYNPKEFAQRGYEIPATWDELTALSDRMAADGITPWSIGLESDAASGWPGTDWIEDIMLRTAGPEFYDKWVAHEIPWTAPEVKRAFELFGKIACDPKYVYGGTTNTLTMNFGDAANPLFTDPPRAFLHRQASFITSFIREQHPDLIAGEDYNFFPFPPIDPQWGNPMMGGADIMIMCNDTPEAGELINYLSSAEAQEIFVSELGKLGVNHKINPDAYPDDLTRSMAEALHEAPVFRFDGSDSMPGAVGSGAFWEGILNYVSGESLDDVLAYIEAAARETY